MDKLKEACDALAKQLVGLSRWGDEEEMSAALYAYAQAIITNTAASNL